jgi:hypothetical protein
MDILPHRIIEEAVYKHPGDWAGQLHYITSRANEFLMEQAVTIEQQRNELFELKRDKAFLTQANRSLAPA